MNQAMHEPQGPSKAQDSQGARRPTLKELLGENTLSEWVCQIRAGLRLPPTAGEHRYAVFQLRRVLSPVSGVALPCLGAVLLLALSPRLAPPSRSDVRFALLPTVDFTPPPLRDDTPSVTRVVPTREIPVGADLPYGPSAAVGPSDVPSSAALATATPFAAPGLLPGDGAVAFTKSPVTMPGVYTGRSGGAAGHAGGYQGAGLNTQEGVQIDAAVLRALRWLKQNQQADGSWPKNQTAMTGLAVLSFLGYGVTTDDPEFGSALQRGIEFLLRSQDPNGVFAGNYHHPIATYALCEAAAITHNPNVQAAAERAVAVIVRGQHPSGGFDYGVKQSERDDTSVMGWCAQALKAAKVAQLKVEGLDAACALAVRGFQRNAAPDGGFGYTGPGRGGLSAVGSLCLQMLTAADMPEIRRTLSLMDDWVCDWTAPVAPGSNPQYYFYYATQAKFRDGGGRWDKWNRAMWSSYVKNQKVQEKAIADAAGELQSVGWWENADQHSDRPVMDTCLAALQLMVYYRFSPTLNSGSEPGRVATSPNRRDVAVETGNL